MLRTHAATATDTRLTPLSRRIAAFLAAAAAIIALTAPATADASVLRSDVVAGTSIADGKVPAAAAPDIDARAGILVGTDGSVLWARNAEGRMPMASTTKIMTGLLAAEQGRLGEVVTVSRAAAGVEYATGLKAGDRMTRRGLLQLALVASSNDAAYALGESVSGSMPEFVKRMNERAAELGLEDTHYANPHGLDAAGHYSSPADLAKLGRVAMNNPDFRRTVGIRQVSGPGGRALKTTDDLLGRYPGLDGVKTGFTDGAKFSFVASAKRNGVSLMAVVIGTSSDASRFAQSARLLDWGFRHTAPGRTLATEGETVGKVRVGGEAGRDVPVKLAKGASAEVFGLGGAVTRESDVPTAVALPVFAGQPLGEVRVKQGDRVLAKLPVVAAASVGSLNETVGAVPVADYLDRTVVARTADVKSVPRFDASKPVKRRVDLDPKVTAPVAKGARLGEVVYTQGDKVVMTVPVLAGSAVKAPDTATRLRISLVRGWRNVVGGTTMAQLQLVPSP